jgi:ABC-type transport system involved in cytochrome bd biosynthesis fused ATPase/permease subunit
MDEIILLENGTIVEMGTYDELKKRNGAFVAFLDKYTMNEETEAIEENDVTTKTKKLKY